MSVLKLFLDRSIRAKINASILLLLLAISLFNLLFFPAQQKSLVLEGIKSKGESIASMLVHDLGSSGYLEDQQSVEGTVKKVFQDPSLLFVEITRHSLKDTLILWPEITASDGRESTAVLLPNDCTNPLNAGYLCVIKSIPIDGQVGGSIKLGLSTKSAKAEMAKKRMLVLGVDLLMIILGMVLASLLSTLLTRPIHKIAKAADRLTEGEWGIQVPFEQTDEIGVLGGIFNRMSLSLKESKDELEQYSQTLAQKVEERTSELTKANQELESNEATITKMLKDLNSVNKELGQTKSQLINIFKSVVDRAIITIDTEGKITFYSKSSELIFGYEVTEVVGKKWIRDFFTTESDFIYILLEHTREAGIYKGEVELTRRGKQSFAAVITITPLKGEEGDLTGYTLIVEDITQKKKTEEDIRLLSFAVGSATDGAVVIDMEGKILFVNQSHARMHGYEPYEMIGRHQKEFYPRRYWPVLDHALQQIFTEGCWTAELEEPKKNGSVFPAQISSSLIKDPEGRPVGILEICHDISEKKSMEREILQSNRELLALNTIASTVGQSLNLQEILDRSLSTILELSHCPEGWVLLVDRECKNKMNLTAHQGLSRNLAECEGAVAHEDCLCWEVVESKQPRLIGMAGCRILREHADIKNDLCSHLSIPLRSKDQVLGVMNLVWQSHRDFSKREEEFFSSVGNEIGIAIDNALLFEDVQKTKEKLQKLNRKLEEASQIKSEFLANTSHELRTPLNSIIGFLGLSLDGYCANREEEREFLRNAQQSAKHLLAIINDVLDLAKIEAGRMELELGEVDLKIIFDEVRLLAEVQAQQKKLKLEFHCDDDPSPRVYADSGKLRQVMINLLGNAIKFTDQGRIVVKSTVQEQKGNVLIEVGDTGVGIPLEMKDKLFHKFRQVDGSSTRRHGGTGLGLTITKNLVEMMGGLIKLESRGAGKGVIVSFTVPIFRENQSEESAHAEKETSGIKGAGKDWLALIVEDDPVYGCYLETVLEQEGFATILTRNPDDAVTLVKEQQPNIVLLDFCLPQKMGGEIKDAAQIVKMLQRDASTRSAGIIIITGQDRTLAEERLAQKELDPNPPVLSKPVDQDELLKTIRANCFNKQEKEFVG